MRAECCNLTAYPYNKGPERAFVVWHPVMQMYDCAAGVPALLLHPETKPWTLQLMLRWHICIKDLISPRCRTVAAGSRLQCSPLAACSTLHSSTLAAGFRRDTSDSSLTVMLLSGTYLSKAGEIIREGLTAAARVVDDYLSVKGSKRHAHGHTVVIVGIKGRNITALAQACTLRV